MSALLFHHTCHGGERNKCRNKEEEHGKHLGDRIYLIRISAVAVEAHVVAAIGDVPRRLTDIGKLRLGVLYRFFRLRKLALCVELCGLIAPLGIGELVFLIIQAVLSRCKLCTRRLYRRFALFKLCVSRVKRCFLLGFVFVYRRHCRRKIYRARSLRSVKAPYRLDCLGVEVHSFAAIAPTRRNRKRCRYVLGCELFGNLCRLCAAADCCAAYHTFRRCSVLIEHVFRNQLCRRLCHIHCFFFEAFSNAAPSSVNYRSYTDFCS